MQDMHKLMNKDKIILRFTARMTPGSSVSHADAGRRFVLSYFMMDDSLLIFEPPVRNSGIIGGKFLERQRVYKPQSEEIYTYQVRHSDYRPSPRTVYWVPACLVLQAATAVGLHASALFRNCKHRYLDCGQMFVSCACTSQPRPCLLLAGPIRWRTPQHFWPLF